MNLKKIDKKKLFAAAGIIIIILGIIILMIVFSKKQKIQTNSYTSIKTSKNIGVFEEIYKDRIYFPNLSNNGNVLALADLGRYFSQINPQTKEIKKIYSEEILSPQNVYFSHNGNYAIVKSNYLFTNVKLYDFSSDKTAELNENMENVVWSRDDKKIYYIYNKANDRFDAKPNISVSNPDGSDWQKLADLDPGFIEGGYSFTLNNDNTKIFIFYYSALGKGIAINSYNLQTKQIEKIALDNIDMSTAIFSPDGKKMVYNQLDLQNSDTHPVGIYSLETKENKILKDSYLIDNGIWFNNNQDFIFSNGNELKKLNTDTLKMDIISLANQEYNILEFHNLMVDPEDKYLYFTNENDWLYRISLKE